MMTKSTGIYVPCSKPGQSQSHKSTQYVQPRTSEGCTMFDFLQEYQPPWIQSSPYVMASNPFVLRWKDHSCSQWPIDTDADGEVPDEQLVVRPAAVHAAMRCIACRFI
jgi:hypothetical protein